MGCHVLDSYLLYWLYLCLDGVISPLPGFSSKYSLLVVY